MGTTVVHVYVTVGVVDPSVSWTFVNVRTEGVLFVSGVKSNTTFPHPSMVTGDPTMPFPEHVTAGGVRTGRLNETVVARYRYPCVKGVVVKKPVHSICGKTVTLPASDFTDAFPPLILLNVKTALESESAGVHWKVTVFVPFTTTFEHTPPSESVIPEQE